MPLLTKVGSFTKPTATGLQAITGVGFAPKALLFWTVANTTSGSFRSGSIQSLGFTTGPTNSYAQSSGSTSGVTTSSSQRKLEDVAIVITATSSTAVFGRAVLDSLDADGFTLNWTTANSSAYLMYYLAIGGDDLTAVRAVNWQTPTAPGLRAVTGVGFSPDCVLHLHAGGLANALPTLASSAAFGLGMMTKNGEQFSSGMFAANGVSPSQTRRNQDIAKTITSVTSSGSIFYQGAFSSMDTDGFTVDFDVAPAAYQIVSLCLKGGAYKIGRMLKSTAAAPVAQAVGGVGFAPKAVMLAGVQDIVQASPTANAAYGLGARVTARLGSPMRTSTSTTPAQPKLVQSRIRSGPTSSSTTLGRRRRRRPMRSRWMRTGSRSTGRATMPLRPRLPTSRWGAQPYPRRSRSPLRPAALSLPVRQAPPAAMPP
jgi:hypothetical protein